MTDFYHVTPFRNWAPIKRSGLLPGAQKRGMHADDPDEPRIYLFESLDTAEDALGAWMAEDWFPRDRYFAIIKVTVYGTTRIYEDPELADAVYVRQSIPPAQLELVRKADAGEPEVVDHSTPKGWVWAYHITPEQFLLSISARGLEPNLHPHAPGGVPVLFVEPDVKGVEPYWGPGMALLRFKTPDFGATEDGETVLFGGSGEGAPAAPFAGAAGSFGAVPPEKIQVLRGKRFEWLLP